MTPYEYISSKIYTVLKPSSISGIGVFSIKEIPDNTNPFEHWNGKSGMYKITKEEFDSLPIELQNHIRDIFLYPSDYPNDTNVYIKLQNGCHWVYTTPYYFMNSSTIKFNISKDTMKTVREIRKGEELLSNYKRYERLNKKDLI